MLLYNYNWQKQISQSKNCDACLMDEVDQQTITEAYLITGFKGIKLKNIVSAVFTALSQAEASPT